MTVYADILFLLNFAVDYFLISLTARLVKTGTGLGRQLLGAAIGGASSLTLFLPELNVALELLIRLAICAVITLASFGFGGIRRYLRAAAVFFAVSAGYAGAMLGIWQLIHPNGLIIRNSVVYLNISPLFLIGVSVAAYFIILLAGTVLGKRGAAAEKCEIRVYWDSTSSSFTAIADTGNSLEDSFGTSEVIVADRAVAEPLLEGKTQDDIARRYRVIPCSTVSGGGVLEGYRCDKACIVCGDKTTELSRPILATSKTPMGGDFSAVIDPKIIE